MTLPIRSEHSTLPRRLLSVWIAGAVFILCALPLRATAQTTDDPWATPVNLSHSGTASGPAMLVDGSGVVHVIWRDAGETYMYSRLEGGEWSAPGPTELHRLFRVTAFSPSSRPFQPAVTPAILHTGPNPLFLAGPGPYSYAFWVTPEGLLYSSRALSRDVGRYPAWSGTRLLSVDVASFAAAVDLRGDMHVAFFRIEDNADFPPGLYYTRSTNGGLSWKPLTRIFESPYLRTLTEGEANLSLATAGNVEASTVYLAWDHRARKQIFVATSADGGATWAEPERVDGPSPDSGSARPFNIRVGATEDGAVLVWQNGDPGGTCTQVYRSTSDAGVTWSEARFMLEGLPGCAGSNEFVIGVSQNPLYLFTDLQDQSFLSAWNGSRWSEPQAQPILSGFEEPEIFTSISLGCHRVGGFGKLLYVVGCDEGEGGDIWITSRDLGSTSSWFSPQVWTQPLPLSRTPLEVSGLELVSTGEGRVHAVFSQPRDPAIYYTRWDGATWSRITAVLQLPDGDARSPAIAVGPENELFLIALSSEGALHYARAKGSEAATASRWSTPERLPLPHDGAVSPASVAWDSAGRVVVAYSVPVYEERGVYIVRTDDRGETWSTPMQVFDGAEAGFDLVGAPALLITPDGHLHLQWKRQSIPTEGASQPLSLYHAWSSDGGRTFSQPELVVEGPITWHRIVADGDGYLHRLWQRSDAPSTVWDQVSLDGGVSWQVPLQLASEGGQPKVTTDPIGRLHLLDAGSGSFGHWLWNGSRWQAEPPFRWSLAHDGLVELLAATVSSEAELVVVLAGAADAGGETSAALQYATRHLILPAGRATTAGESVSPPPSRGTATPAPEPTTTLPAENESPAVEPVNAGDRWSPFLVTVLPSALLLLAVFGYAAVRAVRSRTR